MKKLYASLLGVAIATSPSWSSHAQTVQSSNGSSVPLAPLTLNKKAAKLIAPKGFSLRTDFVKGGTEYFVLAFDTILSPELEPLVSAQAQIRSYIPENMYLCSAPSAEPAVQAISSALKGKIGLLGAGALPVEFKLDRMLLMAVRGTAPLTQKQSERGMIASLYDPADRTALERTLNKWGVAYERTLYNEVHILHADAETACRIAALPYVSAVGLYEEAQPLAFEINWITQPNRIQMVNYDHLKNPEAPIGRGITFANWETYGAESQYPLNTYGRNVSGLTDQTYNAHGTNCGLIATGADNIIEGATQGMAPGTQNIAMNDQLAPWGIHHTGVKTALEKGYKPLVSNHSVGWLDMTLDAYNDAARLVDENIMTSNAYMCCYPTGNHAYGKAKYDNFTEYDYGRITGNIKTNKNGLAVHSTIYPGVDVTWANFGPTWDGRMKPEICAQGSGGTSYASPGVAGLSAVLFEQFAQSFPQSTPRADVVKAVIINTALDVRTYANQGKEEGYGIDFRTGFGEVNPPAAVQTLRDRRVSFDRKLAKTGEVDEMKINVPAGQTELRVTLYWNDTPASVNASRALVNDLDLEVVSPSGKVYLPWTLDPSPANVSKPAVRAVNSRDNVERVLLTAATKDEPLEAGEYTIRVKGKRIASFSGVNFVTTWEHKARGIVWTSIPEGYRVEPGEEIILSWDMTLPEDEERQAPNFVQGKMTPTVYYQYQEGGAWIRATAAYGTRYWQNDGNGGQTDQSGTVFGKNFLKWIVPQGAPLTPQLRFRVVAGDMDVISAAAQVGEHITTRPSILSFSPEKVRLSWDTAERVTQGKYIIYALYDKYMEPVAEFPIDTTEGDVPAPEGKTWTQDNLFAVAVMDESRKTLGKRSLPAGLNPFNEESVNGEDLWQSQYEVCTTDQVTLKTNQIEGTVQWYRDNTALDDEQAQARKRTIGSDALGKYHYTIANAEQKVVFTSPTVNLVGRNVALNDTAQWGNYAWKGYVFNKAGRTSDYPLLTNDMPLFGKFDLRQFSFNSHTELFTWDSQRASNIADYVGCTTSSDQSETTIVMKRRGFAPGRYRLQFERSAKLASCIVRDGQGKLLVERRAANNSQTTAIGTYDLDENSTIELQWNGEHCIFTAALVGGNTDKPGASTGAPSFWFDPSMVSADTDGKVVAFYDSHPSAERYAAIGTPATLNTTGSNFNPTLTFEGKGGYRGGVSKFYDGNTTTDFVVVSSGTNLGKERIVSYGYGLYDTDKWDGVKGAGNAYSILIDGNRRISTQRAGVEIKQTRFSGNPTRLVTTHYSPKVADIAINGSKAAGSGTATADNFTLRSLSLGMSFNEAEPHFFNGNIAEVIHYDQALTTDNEKKVRSYLALKHGITLDHDYKMGSNVVYPAASSQYKYQIAGIGSHKISRFAQKQSRGQMSNGTAAQLILSRGDVARSNAENPATFAADQSFYVLGASSNAHPAARNGEVSTVHYQLRTTLPTTAQTADDISLSLPYNLYNREGKAPYLEVATTELTDATPDETNHRIVPFKRTTAADGTQLITATFAPSVGDSYFRLFWKDGVISGITDNLTDATTDGPVVYDPATHRFTVQIHGATALDLLDLQGRTILNALPVVDGMVTVPTALTPTTYVVRIHRTAAPTLNIKWSLGE